MQTNRVTRIGFRRLMLLAAGAVTFVSGVSQAEVPPNDNCATATIIPGSAPDPAYVDMIVTTDATPDPADPALSCNLQIDGFPPDGENTVWYEWTPEQSGTVNITTFGSTTPSGFELDTAHGAFIGTCDALVEVACVDIGLNDNLVFDVEAGQTYRIKVGEFANGLANPDGPSAGGNLVLGVQLPPPPEQYVLESARHNTSAPLSAIVGPPPPALTAEESAAVLERFLAENGGTTIINLTRDEALGIEGPAKGPSTGSAVAGQQGAYRGSAKVLQSFDGGSNQDNGEVLGGYLAPPDTIGDVGRTHYVQMFNLLTEIFDKEGNSVLGPFPTNAFFNGLGGQCEFTNDGDPIVLYDEETDRWLVSQFAAAVGDGLCVAISTTSDPTGSYHQYEFDFAGIGFPDYPKYGFSSGSINVMANMFNPFQGAGLGVIDKEEAYAGGPATMVFYVLGSFEFGFIPGDNDGPVFDNTKPTFFTNNGSSGTSIDVWEITPDYETPENTTIAEVAKIPVSPFDTEFCDGPREACIAQPGSGTGDFPANVTFLEVIADRMMHRAQTRDFGDRKEAVMSHTVDVDGTGRAGVRWYELRNHKDRGWELKKEGNFSPDSDNRWMSSIAMTASGETCLGYSISSETTYPSIGVAGRKGTANHMNVREAVAYDGNATGFVQRQTARWGDYSSMNIDPVDDSCWYTTEYASPINPAPGFVTERFGWATRIIQFQLPGNGASKKSGN